MINGVLECLQAFFLLLNTNQLRVLLTITGLTKLKISNFIFTISNYKFTITKTYCLLRDQ